MLTLLPAGNVGVEGLWIKRREQVTRVDEGNLTGDLTETERGEDTDLELDVLDGL